jgi:hypothetical protein
MTNRSGRIDGRLTRQQNGSGPRQTRGDSGGEYRQISERRRAMVASPRSGEELDWRMRTRGGRGRTWIRTRRRERPRRMAIYPT